MTCFDFGFVAALQKQDAILAVPFRCTTHYGRSCLGFSDETPDELADKISGVFWSLLLEEPHDLADYDDSMFHAGIGVWIDYGVSLGRPYMDERRER